MLIEAEDVHQHSRTLKEVRTQANLRILRANTNLLKGDNDKAVELYLSAAEFFMPFDKAEGVELLHNLAHSLYETGRRSLAGTFHVGARLLEAVLTTDSVAEDRAVRAKTRYRLSLLYRNAAGGQSGPETLTLLEKAVNYAREGLSDLKEVNDPFQITAMKVSLGNCLFEVAKLTKDVAPLFEAKSMLKSARNELLAEGAGPELLACVHNGLGSAILEELNHSDIEEADALVEAIGSYQAAIAAAEECGDPEIWGVANHNLGNALAGLARLKDTKPEERGFLRVRAVAAVLAAIETYPEALFPFNFAAAHTSLAQIFWDMARAEQVDVELCLVRSMNSWTAAQHFYPREQFPDQWAEIQMHIGAVYGAHASIDGIETKREDLLEAQRCLSEALDVFKERGAQPQIDYCSNCLELIARRIKDSDKHAE